MAISTPVKTQINHVATAREYSQKQTFLTISGNRTGSFLTQATVLLHDDILRFQKGPNGYFTAAEIADFNYDEFAGNVLWFMDELVGMESDWNPIAEPDPTPSNPNPTAYGYVQFTEATIATAVTRYATHIKSFNDRKNIRSIKYWSVPISGVIYTPLWLVNLTKAVDKQPNDLPGPGYRHKYELDKLTYDQTVALAFIHLHSAAVSKDSNFRLLSKGDVTAAKEIYSNNHHTNPDAATLLRLNVTAQSGRDKTGAIIAGIDPGFFRIHYVPATTLISIAKQMPIAQAVHLLHDMTVKEIINSKYKDVVNKIKSWFGL